jgi:hypothetical protein
MAGTLGGFRDVAQADWRCSQKIVLGIAVD